MFLQLVARATKKSLLAQLSCRVPTLEIQRSLAKKVFTLLTQHDI
jgi:hypothetical protein